MSERRFDDSPAPEDERALREAWQGDTPPAPDAALDARVRAAVEVELAAGAGCPGAHRRHRHPPARWQRLRVPLALAATVLLSFGAIRVMFPTAVAPQPMTPEREQAAASAPMRPENDAVQGAAPSARACACQAVGSPGRADAPPAATEFRAAPRANAERQRQAAGVEPSAARGGDVQGCRACGPLVAADAAPARARLRREIRARRFARRAAGRVHAQACRAARGAGARGVLGARADPAPRHPSPGCGLVRIRAQLGRGERIAARRALEEWVKAHPQAELPDWARALLAEETRVLP